MTCKWQVEINEFCRKVLAKHWPAVHRHDDVRTFPDGDPEAFKVDVICGGFPCQDISWAGKGAGIEGERSGLWTEYARIVRVLRPKFVVVENVAALLERGLGRVLGDLADIGFDAEWSMLSSCTVGASHMRRRLFVVAYSDGIDGRARVRDSVARAFRPLQVVHDFEGQRVGRAARVANPSALYGGADGLPHGMDRNHAIGNTVDPAVAEWIGRRLMESCN